MQHFLNYWFWFGSGAALILLEFFVPGLFVIFLGLGALLTGGLIYASLIRDAYQAILFFAVSSVFMLMTLRRILLRFYPAQTEISETDEDQLVIGAEAISISVVTATDFSGRIRFRGTTWSARSVAGDIAANQKIRITGRENIHLLIEKI